MQRKRRARNEEGYNLVVLVMAITVLNILVAASLPLWSQMIQREKEEELIFRGLQYAEAIRVFHNRFQRYPNTLKELVEVEPRSIRQLWKDPMTEDGKWQPIFQGQPPNPVEVKDPNDPNGRGENGGTKDPSDERSTDEEGSSFGGPESGEKVQVGPIIGVKSRSSKKSILLFFGREKYDEWQFTEELVTRSMVGSSAQVPGAAVPTGQLPVVTTRWVGRPLPSFLGGQTGQNMPQDGSGPGGMGGFGAPGGQRINPGQRNPGSRNPGQRNPSSPGGRAPSSPLP